MTKKLLIDLENFSDIFKTNQKLRETAWECAMDSAYCFVNDILYKAPSEIEYSIGGSWERDLYFSIEKCELSDVITWIKQLLHDYCIFTDETTSMIDKFEKYANILRDANCGYINMKDTDYEYIEAETGKMQKRIETEILKYCCSEYDAFMDDDYLEDYALSMGIFDDYYVDEYGTIYRPRNDEFIGYIPERKGC